MNTGEEVPVHERIISPLIVRSEHIILHLFRNQILIRCNAKVLVGNALEFEGILVKDSPCFHCLHADEGAKPEVEGSPEEIDVGMGCMITMKERGMNGKKDVRSTKHVVRKKQNHINLSTHRDQTGSTKDQQKSTSMEQCNLCLRRNHTSLPGLAFQRRMSSRKDYGWQPSHSSSTEVLTLRRKPC